MPSERSYAAVAVEDAASSALGWRNLPERGRAPRPRWVGRNITSVCYREEVIIDSSIGCGVSSLRGHKARSLAVSPRYSVIRHAEPRRAAGGT
jgi:hypothetical protein